MKRHRSHPAAKDAGTKRQGVSTKVWLQVTAILCGVWLLVFFATDYRVGGFRPCDRLDDRLCHDLGPARCSVWMYHLNRAGSGSMQPEPYRRRHAMFDTLRAAVLGWDRMSSNNPRCYRQLDDYQEALARIATSVDAKMTSADAPAATPTPSNAPSP